MGNRYFIVAFVITNTGGITGFGSNEVKNKSYPNRKSFIEDMKKHFPSIDTLVILSITELSKKDMWDYANFE